MKNDRQEAVITTLLFDLDGTLVDSAEGIYRSLCYALEKANLPIIAREQIKNFIGPPFDVALKTELGLEGKANRQVWNYHVAYYHKKGWAFTTPVPGMPELCRKARKQGFRLAVATCKPWVFCGPIIEKCGYTGIFEIISGSYKDGVGENKTEVIRNALTLLKATPRETLMIGDRAQDILGARDCGIQGIGVDFCGYAHPGEMKAAKPLKIVTSPEELWDFLKKINAPTK